MSLSTALVTSARFLDPGIARDDSADSWTLERHTAILDALTLPPIEGVVLVEPTAASPDTLSLVHTPEYVALVRAYADHTRTPEDDNYRYLTPNVALRSNTFELASLAAGAACTAVDAVVEGRARNALVHARPGDHHAGPARGEGFCVFNSGAVAARHAQRTHGLERVLIVDFDVHHCNGTQAIFTADPSVTTLSLHGSDGLYPRTGHATERGTGPGRGATINFPLPAGSGDAEAVRALRSGLRRVSVPPDLVIVIAGFDAHRSDPLGNLRMTDAGLEQLTSMVLDHAANACGGRVVSLLAGGYDVETTARNARRHCEQLAAGSNR